MTVHCLRREVRPGPGLRHHVGEAPGELDEEVEPGNIVHVIVQSFRILHGVAQQVSLLTQKYQISWVGSLQTLGKRGFEQARCRLLRNKDLSVLIIQAVATNQSNFVDSRWRYHIS